MVTHIVGGALGILVMTFALILSIKNASLFFVLILKIM